MNLGNAPGSSKEIELYVNSDQLAALRVQGKNAVLRLAQVQAVKTWKALLKLKQDHTTQTARKNPRGISLG